MWTPRVAERTMDLLSRTRLKSPTHVDTLGNISSRKPEGVMRRNSKESCTLRSGNTSMVDLILYSCV